MNFVVSLVHILLAAVIHFSPVKTAHIPKEGERSKNDVVQFIEVYNKSLCRTREVLVDIFQEYPEEIEHTFIPSCVALQRCAGCCTDEALECVAIETRNVTLESPILDGPGPGLGNTQECRATSVCAVTERSTCGQTVLRTSGPSEEVMLKRRRQSFMNVFHGISSDRSPMATSSKLHELASF